MGKLCTKYQVSGITLIFKRILSADLVRTRVPPPPVLSQWEKPEPPCNSGEAYGECSLRLAIHVWMCRGHNSDLILHPLGGEGITPPLPLSVREAVTQN